ncbi:phenylpyruvate tautomerase PptA (4-oxalocrotonate tautomerase family) [Kibdelosporangium banguiense]|uniref:Phenylpyruvate tautomerase PptA (4-oxalocrotonate tautomerase family) n=1 Tax=Kibdelosporangium banguiense TaxID=1365924 RepID=A0ABS4TNU1_9PSEU|nr:tautomerase family protein [Kibdelosporangium banguiense]MBP2326070.1 phenylpyruvate tautomerase PptA (4-oxalocrotonate tautomerase family) [Kibdelosporangium banguiense]
MPMIQLTVPEGSLTAEGRAGIQRELASLLLRWEGAPDNSFFRAQAWSYLHELPAGVQATAEDDLPRLRIDVTVPAGALSDRRKAGLIKDATDAVLRAAGLTESDALRVWVLIHEQVEGTWGAGGHVVRFSELAAMAKEQKADA